LGVLARLPVWGLAERLDGVKPTLTLAGFVNTGFWAWDRDTKLGIVIISLNLSLAFEDHHTGYEKPNTRTWSIILM
jgi:hypothetical protein